MQQVHIAEPRQVIQMFRQRRAQGRFRIDAHASGGVHGQDVQEFLSIDAHHDLSKQRKKNLSA